MSRVVLVSNRVDQPRRSAPPGGLAVVLGDVLKCESCLWFGWNGHVDDDLAYEGATPDVMRRGRTTYATLPMTEAEHREFYLGYANSVLWPVFHNRLDVARLDAGFFDRYVGVNRRLARSLKPLIEPDDRIWVHDYHFIPLAYELRRLGVANPIGFFLHIPVPPSQTFVAIPEHVELMRALSAYDLIGLQTRADVANLIRSFEEGVSGSILQDGRMRVLDRLVRIGSFPVGITPSELASARSQSAVVQGPAGTRRIIGVDRLDYTKGLPEKFRSFGHLLETNAQYRRRVVLTQIAPPTRDTLEPYSDIRATLEGLLGEINGRFGELDWVPIHYIHRNTARQRLPDIYRSAKIGLVTPLRDGMNLVAKEYVAAQDAADPGVLVLSRFAGAAEEMKEALVVNPYNIPEMAGAIKAGLEMDRTERVERHRRLLLHLEKKDSAAWSRSFLSALAQAVRDRAPARATGEERLRQALDAVGKRAASSATGATTFST